MDLDQCGVLCDRVCLCVFIYGGRGTYMCTLMRCVLFIHDYIIMQLCCLKILFIYIFNTTHDYYAKCKNNI